MIHFEIKIPTYNELNARQHPFHRPTVVVYLEINVPIDE